jgi:hypothetical protein
MSRHLICIFKTRKNLQENLSLTCSVNLQLYGHEVCLKGKKFPVSLKQVALPSETISGCLKVDGVFCLNMLQDSFIEVTSSLSALTWD